MSTARSTEVEARLDLNGAAIMRRVAISSAGRPVRGARNRPMAAAIEALPMRSPIADARKSSNNHAIQSLST